MRFSYGHKGWPHLTAVLDLELSRILLTNALTLFAEELVEETDLYPLCQDSNPEALLTGLLGTSWATWRFFSIYIPFFECFTPFSRLNQPYWIESFVKNTQTSSRVIVGWYLCIWFVFVMWSLLRMNVILTTPQTGVRMSFSTPLEHCPDVAGRMYLLLLLGTVLYREGAANV